MCETAKPTETFRILKVGTCPSLSLASQITYHLGQNDDKVYLGIAGNSGGLFSKKDVSLDGIIAAIMANGDQPITFKTLYPAPVTRRPIEGGSGEGWRGCRQQGCCRQAYRDVFTASPASPHPARDSDSSDVSAIASIP